MDCNTEGTVFAKKKKKKKKKSFLIKSLPTILAKIYETNFSVSVKLRTTGKVQFQFLNSVLLVLTKLSFSEEDWELGCNSMNI